MNQLPRLLQLCSQALPVGAYAYSQGLEAAIFDATVHDAISAETWIKGVFTDGFVELDLVALGVAMRALETGPACIVTLPELDDYLQASRETSELLLEDLEMGRSLRRLLDTLDIAVIPIGERPSFATQFARAGFSWGIPSQDLMSGFCFSWLENQIAAATKSIPLGQSEAQIMLGKLIALISPCVKHAVSKADAVELVFEPSTGESPVSGNSASTVASDEESGSSGWEFGLSMPGLSMYSSRHEIQEARLYRS